MQSGIILIWAGAILVLAGVLFMAAKALGRERLSEVRWARRRAAAPTLEPSGRNAGFRLKANWPGFALVALGALLLLGGAFV